MGSQIGISWQHCSLPKVKVGSNVVAVRRVVVAVDVAPVFGLDATVVRLLVDHWGPQGPVEPRFGR